MPRKKVKLALIPKEPAWRNTFYRRKKGVLKKLSELSTLCNIKACAFIYGPYEQQPDVWPSPSDAKRLVNMFKSMPELLQCKNMISHEDYLRKRIIKIKDQWTEVEKENRRKETMMLMHECLIGKDLHDLPLSKLTDLANAIDEKMKAMEKRIEALMKTPLEIGNSMSMVGASSKEDSTV